MPNALTTKKAKSANRPSAAPKKAASGKKPGKKKQYRDVTMSEESTSREKKILSVLQGMLKDDREAYAAFWTEFGPAIKEGLLGHDEKPDRKAVLADITCDCDGKIDRFIDMHGVRHTLPLHDLKAGEE